MDRDKMSNFCRGIFHRCFLPSFSSYGWGVSEEKIKTWKVNGRQTTDAKWWQKLTLPLARWANKKLNAMMQLQYCFKLHWKPTTPFFFYNITFFTHVDIVLTCIVNAYHMLHRLYIYRFCWVSMYFSKIKCVYFRCWYL